MKKWISGLFLLMILSGLFAKGSSEPFHETVNYVDMQRFLGDWYVLALIPTPFEKDARYGIENYSIDDKGLIRVEYSYEKKGKEKVMYQKGWIVNNGSNAEWQVQPLWPLKLPYYVIELADDYSYTGIATDNYDYLWIMARSPDLPSTQLESIIDRMVERGFDREQIVYMEQREAR